MRWAAFCLSLWLLPGAMAQDERRLSSPGGQFEFRVFIAASQQDTTLSRLAYQVFYNGERIIAPSLMGLDIYEQEPILGENVGLIGTTPRSTSKYRSMLFEYMQNGSTGRSINLEVRVYNEGVAFRYIVPKSNMLDSIVIDEELTEFRIVGIPSAARVTLPVKIQRPQGEVEIAEVRGPKWPPLFLTPQGDNIWLSTLTESRDKPEAAFSGSTPVVCPWRVISFGSPAAILGDLAP